MKVLIDSRDLVFLHIAPTGSPEDPGPHIWELCGIRHNSNVSAEEAHLYPFHRISGDFPQEGLEDYLTRCPLELRRTPVEVVQQVLGQLTRQRGQETPPLIVTSFAPETIAKYLREYMSRHDLVTLEFLQITEGDVTPFLTPDTSIGPTYEYARALSEALRVRAEASDK